MTDRRVLILEPDEDLAIMVEQFLRTSNFGVARARDPEQARWMAPLIRPHLVLVDYWPSDGEKIAVDFRENGLLPEVPLVMIIPENLDDRNPETAEALRKVYEGFLYKPFADTELLRVVENFTGFGDYSEEEVGSALDQLLDAQMGNPELANVVKDLQKKSKQKENNDAQQREKIDKLQKELEKAEEQSKQQGLRISDLLSRISDMELDQSFTIESHEEDKARMEKEVEKLTKRVEELEKAYEGASELINNVRKMLKKKV